MKRAKGILGFGLTGLAVALVVLIYGVGPDRRLTSAVEPRPGEAKADAKQAQPTSSTKAEPSQSTSEATRVGPLRSTDSDQDPAAAEALSGVPDEDTFRKRMRDRVSREIRSVYSLLIEDLGLAPKEKETLISLLIEDRIARSWTPYQRGKSIGEQERTNNIAAIIGDPKLQEFLALERNLPAFGEVQKIGSMLQQYRVPLADSQRDQLVTTLIEVRDQYKTPPPSDAKRGSIEYLEYVVGQRDEFERHVMELAPSVLLPEQVQYLGEQYQYLAYQRHAAVEQQKDRIAAGEDVLLGYPGW